MSTDNKNERIPEALNEVRIPLPDGRVLVFEQPVHVRLRLSTTISIENYEPARQAAGRRREAGRAAQPFRKDVGARREEIGDEAISDRRTRRLKSKQSFTLCSSR